jgi:malate dehydrogenase
MNEYAARHIKVLVVGNPANTNALVCMTNAPSLPKSAFTAMTRLDENRAYAQVADKLNVPISSMANISVWGNHSITQYPSVEYATVHGKPMRAAIGDDAWLKGEFLLSNQQRGGAIIKARGASSAASAAKAAVDHMRDWNLGTPPGTVSSMGVCSDGNTYGVPEGLIYSFPCICKDGKYAIVTGLKIDDYSRTLIDKSANELVEERGMSLGGK